MVGEPAQQAKQHLTEPHLCWTLTKVAAIREVLAQQLVLLDLEAGLLSDKQHRKTLDNRHIQE